MKKAIFIFSILSLLIAPMTSWAGVINIPSDTESVGTSLTRGTGSGSLAPVIKAKWEMKDHVIFGTDGTVTNLAQLGHDDDEIAPYTQIAPSGIYLDEVEYSVCAVVTDQGVENSNISSVAAREIYYPDGIAFHANPAFPDAVNGGPAAGSVTPQGEPASGYDIGLEGCGTDMTGADEVGFTRLTKEDGYALFCENIKEGNTNLPWFYATPTGATYDYNEICAPDGELMENHAFVYCGNTSLYYEDPAGDYEVVVKAQTKDGQTDVESNILEYLPMQSFDVDFHDGINYGKIVTTGQWYGAGDGITASGDKTFGSVRPTLRNLGNVRLYIGVQQDDMKFGTTNGTPNIKYRARIGNNDADWFEYYPNYTGNIAWLEDILDLSEDEKIDFNVKISQWPSAETAWSGNMILTSQQAEFRHCAGSVINPS